MSQLLRSVLMNLPSMETYGSLNPIRPVASYSSNDGYKPIYDDYYDHTVSGLLEED